MADSERDVARPLTAEGGARRPEALPPWPADPWPDRPVAARLPAALPAAPEATSLANGLVIAAIIIAALYFGRDLLMPLALAILLGFVLDPLVTWLKRRGLPRAAAVAIVILMTFSLLAAIGGFMASHLRQLSEELPVYQANVTAKLHGFRQSLEAPGALDQLRKVFSRMEGELTRPLPGVDINPADPDGAGAAAATVRSGAGAGAGVGPVRVEVVPTPASPVQQAANWLASITNPLVTAGIVLLFAVLVLLDRGDLRDRLLRLAGGNLHRTTDALNEAGGRVSRYLTMQLVVNLSYGLPMALGLWLIGVPGALLWGLVAAVLRFVPILGPTIAAIFPAALAFATDPGWGMLLWTLGLILTLELISNNVIEPWLYGASTGMSPLSVILSMTFWTAIWGPVGLVLSVPITVTLLVLGRHLPQLQFFDVLLGSDPVLDMPTRLYQRLLAGDFEDASELAIEVAEEKGPGVFYDTVGIPTLRLATEAHTTVATAEHRHRLVSGMAQVIEDLREDFAVDAALPPEVICIGARWQVDSLAADMVAHTLATAGHPARVAPGGAVTPAYLARLDLAGAAVVCLSCFSPDPVRHCRYLVRRLRQRWPDLKIVVALWNTPTVGEAAGPAGGAGGGGSAAMAAKIGADALALTVNDVLASIKPMMADVAEEAYQPAPIPGNDEARLAVLHGSGALDDGLGETFDAFAKSAANAFDCAGAKVSFVDADIQLIRGRHGSIPGSGAGPGGRTEATADSPRAESVSGHVVADGRTLVIADLTRDPRFAANPLLRRQGMRFFAGAPLRLRGQPIGALCLFDHRPRTLTPRDVLLLEAMAAEVVAAILGHAGRAAARPDRRRSTEHDGDRDNGPSTRSGVGVAGLIDPEPDGPS